MSENWKTGKLENLKKIYSGRNPRINFFQFSSFPVFFLTGCFSLFPQNNFRTNIRGFQLVGEQELPTRRPSAARHARDVCLVYLEGVPPLCWNAIKHESPIDAQLGNWRVCGLSHITYAPSLCVLQLSSVRVAHSALPVVVLFARKNA